ncbi:hypothetical protein ACUXCC_002623 [Cytobacillus horneckiae]|nr:hypothetical protein [Cytobacillus horneckiae]
MKKWILRLGLVAVLTIGLAGNVSAATSEPQSCGAWGKACELIR